MKATKASLEEKYKSMSNLRLKSLYFSEGLTDLAKSVLMEELKKRDINPSKIKINNEINNKNDREIVKTEYKDRKNESVKLVVAKILIALEGGVLVYLGLFLNIFLSRISNIIKFYNILNKSHPSWQFTFIEYLFVNLGELIGLNLFNIIALIIGIYEFKKYNNESAKNIIYLSICLFILSIFMV